jgi:transcriptional regulator with XRE-family HTH domain
MAGTVSSVVVTPTLGENVKSLREQRKISQQALAELIGTSPSTVNNWEKGRKTDLPVTTLLAIAKALDVTVDAVLDGVDQEYAAQRQRLPSRQRLLERCSSLNDVQARSLLPIVESLSYGAPRAGSLPDEEEA